MQKNLLITLFIFIGTNCFSQWTLTNFNTNKNVNHIRFFGATDVWLACDTGVFKSTNNGTTFSQNGLFDSNNLWYPGSILYDVAIINSTTAIGAGLFYLGNDEIIVRTTNSGANWDTVESVFGTFLASFRGADFPTPTTGYVVGWQGRIFRSTNGGLSWNTVYTNPPISLYDVSMVSANVGTAVGGEGIYHTSNGITWSQVLNTPGGYLQTVSFKGNIGYAGGSTSTGNLFKSIDAGLTWSPLNFSYGTINGLQTISNDTVVVVTNNTAYKTCNGGVYWEEFVLPALPLGNHSFNDIQFRGNEGYIACSEGVLLKTSNGGGATKPIVTFTNPAGPFCENMNYTFVNTSPANYTFQWRLDGNLVSTNYNLTINQADSGAHSISLIAFNGSLYDTISSSFPVQPEHFIHAISYDVDTICPGSAGSIKVLNSISGLNYRLRNGFTNMGNAQFGNGNTLTFPVTPQQTTTYNILTYGSNACYSDSLITNISQVVFPNKFLTIIPNDTLICSGRDIFQINIQNTQPGVLYKLYYSNVEDSAFGNGGTVTLTASQIFGTGINRTYTVFAKSNSTCQVVMDQIGVYVDTTYARFNIVNVNSNPGDSISFQNYSHADHYQWTFPPQANIQSSTLQNPKIVINTPGVYPIKLKVTNDEGCLDSVVANVYILSPALSGITTYCGNTPVNPFTLTPYDSYIDKNKNLYLTGSYDPGTFDELRYFVLKIDSSGNLLWFRTANAAGYEKAAGQGIAVDNSGNVYVAGFFKGTGLYFNNGLIYGGPWSNKKGFLVKYDNNGNEKWIIHGMKNASLAPGMWFSDVAIDSSNRIYFTGEHTNGIFTFPDSTTFTATGDSSTAFLMSVDSSGTNYSYTTFGVISGGRTTGEPVSYTTNPRLDILPNQDLLITSCFSDSSNNMHTQFGGFNFTDTCNVIYAAFYNSVAGFTKVIKGPSGIINYMREAISDANNNVYLIGSATKNIEFKNTLYNLDAIYSFGNTSYPAYSFVAKLDYNGAGGWINMSRFSTISDITLNSNQDLMFSAAIDSNGYFANQNLIPQGIATIGKTDAVIGKYSSSGNILFANKLGSINNDFPYTINLDSCDNIKLSIATGRPQVFSWPTPVNDFPAIKFEVRHFSKDDFCTHDANCNGVDIDTLADDASLTKVVLTKTLTGFSNIPVSVRLKSYGIDTLRSAQIKVEVNGVQQINYSWNGLLAQYQSIDSLPLGSLNLTTAGINTIKAFVTLPNNNIDSNNLNDTVYTTIDVCAPLAGTYTIGAGGNFLTFSDATSHLKECGIVNHVYFDVLPGIYTDRIILRHILSSVNDSIVFRSANHDSSSVILQWGAGYPFSNALVELDSTDYLTFYQMTIHNLDMVGGSNMNIRTGFGCKHLNIWNCVVSRLNPDTLLDGGLFRQSNTESDYLNIQNNLFFQGGTAVQLWGTTQDNTIVRFNKFINQTEGGINIQSLINPQITDNYIETNFHKSNAYFGIGINTASGGFNISRNKILVSGNGDAHAIGVSGNYTAISPGLIKNNMISISNSAETSIGLQLSFTCSNINIYNNSFNISGASNRSAGIYGGPQLTNIDFKNNIFRMEDNGYLLWMNNSTGLGLNLDYNCYSTNGVNFARLDSQNVTTYSPTFTQWQADRGMDVHSKYHSANFISPTDLHFINDSIISNAGIPLASVSDDFDGDIRSLIGPDIGCDEFLGTTSIDNIFVSDDLLIFPNPVSDNLIIQLNSNLKNVSIGIYDYTGRLVFLDYLPFVQNQIRLNASELSTGNYIVEILSDSELLRGRFLKK